MARNGSGTYSLPAGNPVTGGTTISSTWANNTLSDIGTALTGSLAKDGQTVPTNNLPMGGFKLTGLAAAVVAGDAARYEQIGALALAQGAAPTASPTFTGTVTAPAFSGPLTGNVTGNVTGSAGTAGGASGAMFFTNGTGVENEIGVSLAGYNQVYLYNNTTAWGLYSASGGSVITYTRATNRSTFSGDAGVGYNQSWQNLGPSGANTRFINTTYTNNTGKAIMIVIGYSVTGVPPAFTVTVDGIPMLIGNGYYANPTSIADACSFIIPNGSTYSTNYMTYWSELR